MDCRFPMLSRSVSQEYNFNSSSQDRLHCLIPTIKATLPRPLNALSMRGPNQNNKHRRAYSEGYSFLEQESKRKKIATPADGAEVDDVVIDLNRSESVYYTPMLECPSSNDGVNVDIPQVDSGTFPMSPPIHLMIEQPMVNPLTRIGSWHSLGHLQTVVALAQTNSIKHILIADISAKIQNWVNGIFSDSNEDKFVGAVLDFMKENNRHLFIPVWAGDGRCVYKKQALFLGNEVQRDVFTDFFMLFATGAHVVDISSVMDGGNRSSLHAHFNRLARTKMVVGEKARLHSHYGSVGNLLIPDILKPAGIDFTDILGGSVLVGITAKRNSNSFFQLEACPRDSVSTVAKWALGYQTKGHMAVYDIHKGSGYNVGPIGVSGLTEQTSPIFLAHEAFAPMRGGKVAYYGK